MTAARFARVHAGLLARKGEATPAALLPGASITYLESRPQRPFQANVQPEAEYAPDEVRGEHFKLTLRMTKEQRRKMWLVSAKLGLPRQAILDRALDAFMAELAGGDMQDCRCFADMQSPRSCDLEH